MHANNRSNFIFFLQGRSADGLALYFGEDPVRCPFEQGETFFCWEELNLFSFTYYFNCHFFLAFKEHLRDENYPGHGATGKKLKMLVEWEAFGAVKILVYLNTTFLLQEVISG